MLLMYTSIAYCVLWRPSRLNLKDLGLDRVLGGGAFGQVWRGTWRGTPVAVKVYSLQWLNRQPADPLTDGLKLLSLFVFSVCLYICLSIYHSSSLLSSHLSSSCSHRLLFCRTYLFITTSTTLHCTTLHCATGAVSNMPDKPPCPSLKSIYRRSGDAR